MPFVLFCFLLADPVSRILHDTSFLRLQEGEKHNYQFLEQLVCNTTVSTFVCVSIKYLFEMVLRNVTLIVDDVLKLLKEM